LAYTIDFENASTAAGPADDIIVTNQLDPNMDWRTLQITQVTFGSNVINVPSGRSFFTDTVDLRPEGSNLLVLIQISLDTTTGILTAELKGIDPTTGEIPVDPMLGILPPNDANNDGEGHISYTIKPKTGLPSGTIVSNSASVVFDTQAPILTNTVTNELDVTAPNSQVVSLPATSNGQFTVSWAGSDDAGGSGVAGFDVYVAVDGGAFNLWLNATTNTSATYTGSPGHTYEFFSVAHDNVGNQQPTPSAAQATTTAVVPPQVVDVVVDGSDWSGSFLSYLASLNAANVGGYSISTGSSQLKTLPWTNLNQIDIVFSQNVNVQESSLQLLGVNVPSYSFSGFSYNAATDTATWTLTQPIAADKLLIDLSDSVTNTSGLALDGEWSDGVTTYPSGNGTPGGAFMFSLNVLPGDENQSGGVNVLDTVSVAHLQGSSASTPGTTYSIFADVNGSGGINVLDTLATNSRQASTLPSGTPAVPAVVTLTATPATRTVKVAASMVSAPTASPTVFSTTPITSSLLLPNHHKRGVLAEA
jgi:hypothetical protein